MRRVTALDSLRGIAASVVVFHHCSLVFPNIRAFIEDSYILRPFIAGPQSVSVFFILTGFVLYGVLDQADRPSYFAFVAKRLIRLWPPMAASIMISVALYWLIQPERIHIAEASPWLTIGSWNSDLSPLRLYGHLMLFSEPYFQQFNNVIWSLTHEIKMSLLFPVLVPFIRRHPIIAIAGSCGLYALQPFIVQSNILAVTIDPARTLHYFYLFVIGAAIAARRETLSALAQTPWGLRTAPWLMTSAVILLTAKVEFKTSLPAAIGATLIVAICATSPRIAAWIDRPICAWLGRISYSLYLIHLPVLLTTVYMLHDIFPHWAIVVAAPFLSVIAAYYLHGLIEQPALHLSRRAGRKFTGVAAVDGQPSPCAEQNATALALHSQSNRQSAV